VAAGTDDGSVGRHGPSDPPQGALTIQLGSNVLQAATNRIHATHWTVTTALRVDTRALAGETVVQAFLAGTVSSVSTTDDGVVNGEWVTDAAIGADDYSTAVQPTAFTANLADLDIGVVQFTVAPGGLQTAGYTKLRIGITTSASPTGANEFNLFASESDNAPLLIVCVSD